ncbi:hypothetical protein J5W02_04040 [Caproiciproducens sp. AGMB10547]|uniref:Zinc ribbon-containing protein n=1 Tax=Caproiciproducens faecalis TaxID=2820301 RepID=A0ABS7DL82_9FIRM|nr:hypothetical protein [Caproiciproducens faecalis]
MDKAGEKPGLGRYKCKTCGEIVVLNDDSHSLPNCPKCGNETYQRVINQ